jgi:hypothetical protein
MEAGPLVAILAHQGGWDEILMVVGPLALIGGLLWLANRRAGQQLEAQQAQHPTPAAPDTDAG